jgi:hypothetical protein
LLRKLSLQLEEGRFSLDNLRIDFGEILRALSNLHIPSGGMAISRIRFD